jgi:hypothetical protein
MEGERIAFHQDDGIKYLFYTTYTIYVLVTVTG